MKGTVKFRIDGREVEAARGMTVLEAALANGIYIPNLCFREGIEPFGGCRLCLVENNEGRLVTACETPAEDGSEFISESERINRIRRTTLSLIIADHSRDCLACPASGDCRLQELSSYLNVSDGDLERLRPELSGIDVDESNPFFLRNHDKCILCGICVRVCRGLGAEAVDFAYRGHDTRIATFMDRDILDSSCVSCGECVEACPVGALLPRTERPSTEVRTVCPYCGAGCEIYLGVRGNRVVSSRGVPDSPVNQGRLCVKGRFALKFVNSPERLKKPLIKVDGEFVEVEWDEAISVVAERLSEYTGEEFAAVASAKCTNEENYLLQKFTRAVMGSGNIDHCARLCHAPSLTGLRMSLGSGAMTNSISELGAAGCILAVGTNPTETHPVTSYRVIRALRSRARLVVVDPRKTRLSELADIHLQNRPGSDIPLLMAMCRFILEEGLHDSEFIDSRTEKFEDFRDAVMALDLDEVERITGVNVKDIRRAAIMYASNSPASIIYSMGITQHVNGTGNVLALSNLALLTGNIGIKSAGINPLRGQNNVQGACDMGALPDLLPGYQGIGEAAGKFSEKWGSPIPPAGLTLPEMFDAARDGKIRCMYIMGENPLLSEPDIERTREALEGLEFLVVQDIFLTETAELADVVLPAASFAEKDGTFTNTERRVQLLRKALDAPGDALPDWQIISMIAGRMGREDFDYESASRIFDEIRELVPSYAGISHERLKSGGIQWPCTSEEDAGTGYLHSEEFPTPTGRASFLLPDYQFRGVPEEYPLVLVTGRNLYQYHTRSMTARVEELESFSDHEELLMNPADASSMGIREGDTVEVTSERGSLRVRAGVTDEVMEGVVFMTFHFADAPANVLTGGDRDPFSGMPGLKFTPVRVCRVQLR
ncbi:formate dehydrogenase subunit alpha [Methanothermobacter marburgensis]|uniref:Predicted formate dehydrogenase, alpha chain n=1 Tax=Methanothermobacter marburgensis (strain ATCC BAA-927 / DSM 2133 / JCM 14651 / NBRC 100331 / OCM 82 / Marburg) TaxID=79929 RepID=D9PU49_METTM|nr:formate dehydrogenase subunit alpha [Methanothermobacter marburgensis]ADL57747.1 predicted formate dehydrogenase, alpha chain [Methanothermobacter marburgensis str. Marburg]WBF09966.1 formate dehydrogenase subunit alpha [Methanothermobacter marburgensis]